MRLLFLHQNLPGQFRHLMLHYAARKDCAVLGLGELSRVRENLHNPDPRLTLVGYDMPARSQPGGHPYLQSTDAAVHRAGQVARALQGLKRDGFKPDVVYAHPGWGESLYVKDVFPDTKLLSYCEFYYHASGQDFGFDSEFPDSFEGALQLRVRNMHHLQSLDCADAGISPTRWQQTRFPTPYQSRIEVVHDGINTERVRPDPFARFTLPGTTKTLTPADEVITYVARNLEPYRGFHTFMRALPEILARRPKAQVVIVGGDDVSYGGALPQGRTYRQKYLAEVQDKLDLQRVHFLGKVPYADYLKLLQVSTVHIYLTYPFVLSWSMLEAMAAGCAVVASRTAPVEEVIQDGENGVLVDFFDAAQLAEMTSRLCDSPDRNAEMRNAARRTVETRFDLHRVCLPVQACIIEGLL